MTFIVYNCSLDDIYARVATERSFKINKKNSLSMKVGYLGLSVGSTGVSQKKYVWNELIKDSFVKIAPRRDWVFEVEESAIKFVSIISTKHSMLGENVRAGKDQKCAVAEWNGYMRMYKSMDLAMTAAQNSMDSALQAQRDKKVQAHNYSHSEYEYL